MKPDLITVLENAGWPVLLLDSSGIVRQANESATKVFGAVLGENATPLATLWSTENETKAEPFLAKIGQQDSPIIRLKFLIKGGATKVFVTHISSSNRDGQKFFLFQLFPEADATAPAKTETKAAPEGSNPAMQKQKLDMALQLTRTVALDFNNALTSILGHTSLLLSRIEPDSRWRSSLLEVEKAAEKAAEIAHDLASFSRQERDTQALAAGNLNDLLRRTIALYNTSATPAAEWKLHFEGKLYSVIFDEAKMQQALMKILDNAVQAVGQDGRITILTRNREIVEPLQDAAVTLPPGRYVMIDITDNGSGIAPTVMSRIFEPFFTTKNGHRGLGLAWSYGIITNAGGSIAVSSEPQRGTSVRIYLPALKKMVEDKTFTDESLRGMETILLVDDEDLLLTMGKMILSSFGYKVLVANSGTKAMDIFTNGGKKIDLVITDLVMPGMSGRELVEQLHTLQPGLRVICSTGYTRPAATEEEANYLQKPFTSQDLLRRVRQTLDREPT